MKYYLKKPVHFKALTNYIKEHEDIIINQTTNKKKKIVSVQTVHNELIKDDRFVLIGHGHYALAEWGYSKGVIKDIIANIFQASNNNALSEDELITKVQEQRMAKENTIRFNLRNNKCFEKTANGKYQLKATLKNDQDINDLPVLSA
jgi:DNA-directed RNA polymerase delta subunit